MRIIRSPSRGERRRAIAIGNFDGVHRGHRAVIAATGAVARERGLSLAVLTFEPHPREVFRPDDPPFRLTREPLKLRRLAECGVEEAIVLPFDRALAALSPEEFARDVLAEGLGAGHVATGVDFRFGSGRKGDLAALERLGAELGFSVAGMAPIGDGANGVAERFSSSGVRKALEQADPEEAARILGDWHRIEGPVLQGDQRGRTLGFPTANQSLDGVIAPAFGIYAVIADILDGPHAGQYPGVASLGLRPTFDKTEPNFETFLFGFSGDLYGATLSVGLCAYLRPEIRFDGVEALVAQMREDADQARAITDRLLAEPARPWKP